MYTLSMPRVLNHLELIEDRACRNFHAEHSAASLTSHTRATDRCQRLPVAAAHPIAQLLVHLRVRLLHEPVTIYREG